VPHFDAVQTGGDQWLETLPPAAVSGMSPDRNCPGLVRYRDCLLDGKPVLRHERASICAQVATECVAKVTHESSGNHRSCNVRPPNRPAIRLQENFIQCKRDAELVEPVDDSPRAGVSGKPETGQSLFEWAQLGEMKREQVDFVIMVVCTQLDPRDHANAGALCRLARGTHTIYCVVVRQS
jgi:hypothetical protein